MHKKKRAFEKARQPANTKLAEKRVRTVRVMGGNLKRRALRMNEGNFNWQSMATARKTKIINVVYNASDNDLVRTNTLVKNCIVQIDPTPFKQWHLQHYGATFGEKKGAEEAKKQSKHVLAKLAHRNAERVVDPKVEEQFSVGRVLACVSSRPGQCGRVDGYILEGTELQFYLKKIDKKK